VRAVIQDRYGPPEILRVADAPVPTPSADEVLIAVRATSINLSDWETLTGSPAYARIAGLRRPRRSILGSDIAGTVVDVGRAVTSFAAGDEVYGDNLLPKGGFAEFAAVPAGMLARKPPELTFAQASTIPQAGAIALQGTAGAEPGTRMLINGAGGGSGAFASQLAKAAGAVVTGVDNAAKLDFMTLLGADEVVDYRTTDFTSTGRTWDLILDLVAHRSVGACRRALAPGGRYQAVGGSVSTLLRLVTVGAVVGRLSGRHIGVLGVREGPKHFTHLAAQCTAGDVAICIDRTFALDEVPQALAYVGHGRSRGKVVVEIDAVDA
jgi:NADPH:quinone reductase-like Zn-dependent oxidoreductase